MQSVKPKGLTESTAKLFSTLNYLPISKKNDLDKKMYRKIQKKTTQ